MLVFLMISFADALVRTQDQSLLFGEEPKVHPELLKEDEGEDGLGAEADEGRNVSFVKGHRALLQGGLEHIHGAGKFSWRKKN